MGILNVTPDSFSDGGRYSDLDAAYDRASAMIGEGAAIVDVGGESTRPGATAVEASVEIDRVAPLIERVSANHDVAVSIDTSKLLVMAAAAAAGACIVNDVYALRMPGARAWAAGSGVGVCLMHMQGEPRTMQDNPQYDDVAADVAAFLVGERAASVQAGIAHDAIALDPGIGFGKGLQHNLTLLKELPRLAALGSPLLVGVSRKSFIGRVLGARDGGAPRGGVPGDVARRDGVRPDGVRHDGVRPVEERLYGGLGLAALAVAMGARIIRTHDVAATRDAIQMVSAVLQGT